VDRQLKLDDRVVSWKEIAEADKDTRKKLLVEYVGKLITTYGLENQLLGFIDPRIDPGLKITDYNYGSLPV
jgi:hypothetical protein